MAGPNQSTVPRLRFGIFELDLSAGELHRNGWKVRLDGQPLAILALLLTRPGDIVTREELRRELWPSAIYVDFEHSINAAVKRLRKTLQDSVRSPRFIETLPRRGYRFIYPLDGQGMLAPTALSRREASPAAPPERPVNIGEVARRFGISADLLRRYEREGLLIPLWRGSKRYFTVQDYPWMATLLHLIREGKLNFAGVRRLLALLPCWKIRGCEHDRKQGCPFIKNALEPCWMNKRGCCGGGESCYSCAVYRSAPECENLKLLLA